MVARQDEEDYFVSLDIGCEGQRILGKNGYGYSQPVSGLKLVALYRCSTGQDHFVSKDPKCEGKTTDELLGYVVPRTAVLSRRSPRPQDWIF